MFDLLSAIAGAVLAFVLTALAEWWRRRRAGDFAGLFVADILERYARACAEHLQDWANHARSDGEVGQRRTNIPPLPDYPPVEWNGLGVKRTETLMRYRADVDETRAEFLSLWEVEDDDVMQANIVEEVAAKGREALRLAKELRAARCLKSMPSTWYERYLDGAKSELARTGQ
jgi:hypothetical protein